jgi:hypothetical protein
MTTISQIAQQVLDQARAEGWKRSQVKAACYERKVPKEEREAIYAALGMAPTGLPNNTPAADRQGPPPPPDDGVGEEDGDDDLDHVENPRFPSTVFENMALPWRERDILTGQQLTVGTRVVGCKVFDECWAVTAELGWWEVFGKLCEALVLSQDRKCHSMLDDEDLELLAEFGRMYPHFRQQIECKVPGLD